MSKSPPIPPEQRAFKGKKPELDGRQVDLSPPLPDEAEVNLDEQGASGNLRQNATHSGNVQDR